MNTIVIRVRAFIAGLFAALFAKLQTQPVTTDTLVADVRAKVEALDAHRKAQDDRADKLDVEIAQLVAERQAIQNDAARAWRIARRFSSLLEG